MERWRRDQGRVESSAGAEPMASAMNIVGEAKKKEIACQSMC